MRCNDLSRTWAELETWFERHGVLVLPMFRGGEPLVRLDDDLDTTREATPEELARVLARLRAVVERFEVKAVYVRQTSWDADNDWVLGRANGDGKRRLSQVGVPLQPGADARPAAGPPTRVTVRVLAGGVVHELLLVADWYAALEESTADLYATIS